MALQLEDIIATLGDAIADRMKKTTGNQDDGFRLVDRARAAERGSLLRVRRALHSVRFSASQRQTRHATVARFGSSGLGGCARPDEVGVMQRGEVHLGPSDRLNVQPICNRFRTPCDGRGSDDGSVLCGAGESAHGG